MLATSNPSRYDDLQTALDTAMDRVVLGVRAHQHISMAAAAMELGVARMHHLAVGRRISAAQAVLRGSSYTSTLATTPTIAGAVDSWPPSESRVLATLNGVALDDDDTGLASRVLGKLAATWWADKATGGIAGSSEAAAHYAQANLFNTRGYLHHAARYHSHSWHDVEAARYLFMLRTGTLITSATMADDKVLEKRCLTRYPHCYLLDKRKAPVKYILPTYLVMECWISDEFRVGVIADLIAELKASLAAANVLEGPPAG